MSCLPRRFTKSAGLALLTMSLSVTGALAQRPQVRATMPPRPVTPPPTNFYPRCYYQPFPSYSVLASPALPVNPNYWVAPGLTINQFAYNQALLGQALSYYPPYA